MAELTAFIIIEMHEFAMHQFLVSFFHAGALAVLKPAPTCNCLIKITLPIVYGTWLS